MISTFGTNSASFWHENPALFGNLFGKVGLCGNPNGKTLGRPESLPEMGTLRVVQAEKYGGVRWVNGNREWAGTAAGNRKPVGADARPVGLRLNSVARVSGAIPSEGQRSICMGHRDKRRAHTAAGHRQRPAGGQVINPAQAAGKDWQGGIIESSIIIGRIE